MKNDLLLTETGPTESMLTDKTNNLPHVNAEERGSKKHCVVVTDEELRKANRLYAFISAVNQSIVRIKSQQDLLDRVCQIAVEIGHYKLARVGLLDENGLLNMVSSLSDDITAAELIQYSGLDFTSPALQHSATGRMLTTGRYVTVNDTQSDFTDTTWKEEVARLNLHSIISLPIEKFGKIVGAFILGSAQQNFFDENEIDLLVETASDISYALENFEREEKRKLAETLVLENGKRFRAMIEKSADIIVLTDVNQKRIYASPAVTKILGYTNAEYLETSAFNIMHNDDRDGLREKLEELLKTPGKSLSCEYRIRHKNGHWVWCQGTITNLLEEPGINAFVSNFRDVTESRTAQQQLLQNQERFTNAQSIAHVGHWQLDFSTGVAVWSAEACRIYGLDPAENKQSFDSWVSFLHPDDRDLVMGMIEEQRQSLKANAFDHRIVRKDGSVRYIHSESKFEFGVNGKPVGLYGISHDITVQKAAQEKLLKEEANLKQSQNIAHVGSWDMDVLTHALNWSDELYNIYGLNTNEVVPSIELFLSFVHPDDRDYVSREIETSMTSLTDCIFTYRAIAKNGVTKYCYSETKFEFDSSHKPLRLYGIVQDITGQKLAEEKIRKSEERYRQILETAQEGVWLIDENNKTVFVNKRFTEIFGYSFTEMMGKSNFDLMDKEGWAIAKEKIERRKHGIAEEFELTYITKSGEKIWTNVAASPIMDDSGRYAGGLAMITDINDRKKAELELRRNEAKLKDAQAISHLGSWEIDMVNNVLHWSDEQFRLLGYQPGEVVPSNELFLGMVHPGDAETIGKSYTHAFAVLEDSASSFRLVLRNGTVKHVFCEWKFEFDSKLKPVRIYGIVQDVTEMKKAEEEIKALNENLENRIVERTSELTTANKALEAFSYSVSHDLRAPVRAVLGFTKIIQNEYNPGFNEDLKELFGHIETSSKRMNAIIDDLLTLAKYEKEPLKTASVDISNLFDKVWDNILFSTPHQAVLKMGELPRVMADASMLEQVLVNLVSNAVKYSSKKENPHVSIGCIQSHDMATFYVKDNGAGFDMKNYDRLFGAFQRLHGSSDFEGTGVGLVLVKKIIERHGGSVWGEGKVDEGAIFYFTLPLAA